MKKLLLLMLFTFTTIASANEEILSFPFTPDNVNDWRYFSDQVMGGVSEGQVSLEQDADKVFIRLSGNVRTDNNGGFIQLRTTTSLSNKPLMFKLLHNSNKEGKKLKGIRLKVKGNGEKYHIFIFRLLSFIGFLLAIKLLHLIQAQTGKQLKYLLINLRSSKII
tara:strand:+ start:56 stop:547 length:492 start_codon:yes stop_codon:yes gene_type:complete